jgi:hypothetical protein
MTCMKSIAGLATLLFLCDPLCGATDDSAFSLWRFENNLEDSGNNSCRMFARKARFTDGFEDSRALHPLSSIVAHDSPRLRIAPGFRIDCRVRFNKLKTGRSWSTIAMKGDYTNGEYVLRLNGSEEGGNFGFFINTGKWEPRVQSPEPVKSGRWYDLSAGWDGTNLWMEVNGRRSSVERRGKVKTNRDLLMIGTFDGALDHLAISNPNARQNETARWNFDGDLKDSSGNGFDATAKKRLFADADPRGKALRAYPGAVTVEHKPELALAPGLRIECSLLLEELPGRFTTLLRKDGEYMLRADNSEDGVQLNFFVFADQRWSPHLGSDVVIETNRWYDLVARWDGLQMTLDVNGRRSELVRSGQITGRKVPLEIGNFKGYIDNLAIENHRTPAVTLRDIRGSSFLPQVGHRERISAKLHNFGSEATSCKIHLILPDGVSCADSTIVDLGDLPTDSSRDLSWNLLAERSLTDDLRFEITCDQGRQAAVTHLFAVFPKSDNEFGSYEWTPPFENIKSCFYVDSLTGDNANDGLSPQRAWRDFTPVNGRVLGAGEQLLIRRGSVINQELTLDVRGSSNNWARIAAYGVGARPTIRRNRDIRDRCALFINPEYLHLSNLIFCDAAKGLIVYYSEKGHRGLLIEDCIAHHIEGLYRNDAHGIPGWSYLEAPYRDQLHGSAGIGLSGACGENMIIRDCEMFQCSWGFYVTGDNVMIDRVFCHDNFVLNTSPHPGMVNVSRARLLRSIFDASGYHASAGTMGIMLVKMHSLLIRDCHFLNQPDSGCHDQGGIDFEGDGYGALVEGCTFRNNAGAAIEMLGLSKPQGRNIEIANSRFFRNNVALKLGPSEIFLWGKSKNPEVCCSTGVIRDNGYVLHPGVTFFTNQAPSLMSWSLSNNREYDSIKALDAAMPHNNPPQPSADSEIWSDSRTVMLDGNVTDDNRTDLPLEIRWELIEAPGTVDFKVHGRARTEALFSEPGDYHLRLVADDGELWRAAHTAVHILPSGGKVRRAWDFARPLDKQGWSEENLGTQFKEFKHTHSYPVREPAGGFYVLAMENAASPALISPDNLKLNAEDSRSVVIRCQNHTTCTHMRVRFTTSEKPQWDMRGKIFAVQPLDNRPALYTADMSDVPGWQGEIKRIRLEFSTDKEAVTGTSRIDYIWIGEL